MNSRLPLFLSISLLQVGSALSADWRIVWQDEFNGQISPDWVFETGTGGDGWGNGELEYYRRENATVENGALVITARHEPFGGAAYTSARMKTQGRKSWKYGRIEARIAMPAFQGAWPAFWMVGDNIGSVGWPQCGELDILEHVNANDFTTGAAHWWGTNGAKADFNGRVRPASAVTNYHLYAIEWTRNAIKWFCDGVLLKRSDDGSGAGMVLGIEKSAGGAGAFHDKFFIILNLAIGGNFPGKMVNNAAFPAKMRVDYLRVYQDASAPKD